MKGSSGHPEARALPARWNIALRKPTQKLWNTVRSTRYIVHASDATPAPAAPLHSREPRGSLSDPRCSLANSHRNDSSPDVASARGASTRAAALSNHGRQCPGPKRRTKIDGTTAKQAWSQAEGDERAKRPSHHSRVATFSARNRALHLHDRTRRARARLLHSRHREEPWPCRQAPFGRTALTTCTRDDESCTYRTARGSAPLRSRTRARDGAHQSCTRASWNKTFQGEVARVLDLMTVELARNTSVARRLAI